MTGVDLHVKCKRCGKTVKARVPRNGDGSAVYPYGHAASNYPGRQACSGRFDLIPITDDAVFLLPK